MVVVRLATPLPQSSEGFYAFNNPFQTDGPKGFTEKKMISLSDIFVRTDLPGVGQKDLKSVTIDDSKKRLIIKATAPSLHINDSSPRSYETYIGLHCKCCEISSFHNAQVTAGVLRLIISTTPIEGDGAPGSPSYAIHRFLYDPDPTDPENTVQEMQPYPFVTQGPDTAYEYKQLPDGSAYVRLDMPGVPTSRRPNFIPHVVHDRVYVVGQAPAVSYDSSGRSYSADAALLDTPVGLLPTVKVESIVENGVIRLFINPISL